ncbi:M23 family metallopeptidase [Clostridium sp.]|uniref:M23 family metallopeptidase n=1 Tax=Clostridium sp. TaxID=1506 RepID=UPI002FCB3670
MIKFKTLDKMIFMVLITIISILIMMLAGNNKSYSAAPISNKVSAFIMKSDGIDVGIINHKQQGEEVISIVKKRYLSKIDEKDMKVVVVDNTITYEEVLCDEKDIYSVEALSNKIVDYNNTHEKNILSFTIVKENEITPVFKKLNNNLIALHSSLHTPTKGWLSSPFGVRDGIMHKGIDFAADLGTPIEAAIDGKVIFSGVANGYGKVIKISHNNNIETVYAHCSKIYVNNGDIVRKGQYIADVGSTGNSTGPHLHFELKLNGNPIDPLNYDNKKQY